MPKVQQEGNGGGSPPSPGSQGHTDQGAADPDQAEKQRKAKHEDDTLEVQRNTLNETKAKNKSELEDHYEETQSLTFVTVSHRRPPFAKHRTWNRSYPDDG